MSIEQTRDVEKAFVASLPASDTRVIKRNGTTTTFHDDKIYQTIVRACAELKNLISIDLIMTEVKRTIFDGVSTSELSDTLIQAVAPFIEIDPAYDKVASRLYLEKIYKEVIGKVTSTSLEHEYKQTFVANINAAIKAKLLDPRMGSYDLQDLSGVLCIDRDHLLRYLGLETLYGRYFLKQNNKRLELPQFFWMRVAMGLALNEKDKQAKAREFYGVLSQLKFISSTPTLFHSGLVRAQLSSCYLSTVNDDLGHIFKCIGDNAHLAKWAGGLGNDWTNIRGTGSPIKSIRATSQGVIPFLKIANDVVVGITRTGIRRGGTCAYLETWHLDIEEFLDLRRNTGDERRRIHDMSTANWIPDLFIKRVMNNQDWTLFSPDQTPELHDLYGKAFEQKYQEYESKAQLGEIQFRVVAAQKLWRKMLSRLFETGHPWITFKDPCNVRSPQDHVGVVHSSNLCTEITLNTSKDETAVCNLGSINLSRHIVAGHIDEDQLAKTVTTAIRMLDNVIDLNFYPTKEAEHSNLRHRPIGLGVMGFADALFKSNINFSSEQALTFADTSMEMISYYAILASSQIAREKGAYQTYKGSKWDRGIFPFDTLELLEQERGMPLEVNKDSRMNWQPVREQVAAHGMRNSNIMAIAPTATIANIAGCFPSIEPIYKNLYVKSNVSGEFTIINHDLIDDLKKHHLWNEQMLQQLKYYDGGIQSIDAIPTELKQKYKTAFELDPAWLIRLTAARGKWIDQSQSHNVFMEGVSGKKLNEIYLTAFKCGLKTTYYLRTLGASQIEKSTLDAKKFGFTQKREYGQKSCAVADPECESCQ